MMIVSSSCLGRMLFFWMNLWMQVMFLRPGLSGLVLLRLRLLTPVGSLVVLLQKEVWFLGVGGLASGLSGLVATRSGRCVVVLLMRMVLLMFSETVIFYIAPLLFKAVMDVLD